jgi:membrane-bound inhibitor of C-type lysozyme
METVVALLMFVNFEIKEHRIQESMGMCLRGKREAERQYSETVSYKCVKTQAELEVNKDGSRSIKKIVLGN